MAFFDIKNNNSLYRLLTERVGLSSAIALIVAAAITAATMLLFGSSLSTFEERVGSYPWLLASDTSPEERITIVSIDERSIAEVGPWPWSWRVIADLVDKINSAGAQLLSLIHI